MRARLPKRPWQSSQSGQQGLRPLRRPLLRQLRRLRMPQATRHAMTSHPPVVYPEFCRISPGDGLKPHDSLLMSRCRPRPAGWWAPALWRCPCSCVAASLRVSSTRARNGARLHSGCCSERAEARGEGQGRKRGGGCGEGQIWRRSTCRGAEGARCGDEEGGSGAGGARSRFAGSNGGRAGETRQHAATASLCRAQQCARTCASPPLSTCKIQFSIGFCYNISVFPPPRPSLQVALVTTLTTSSEMMGVPGSSAIAIAEKIVQGQRAALGQLQRQIAAISLASG